MHVPSPPIRPSAKPFKGLPLTGLSHQTGRPITPVTTRKNSISRAHNNNHPNHPAKRSPPVYNGTEDPQPKPSVTYTTEPQIEPPPKPNRDREGAVPTSAHRARNTSDRFWPPQRPEGRPTTTPACSPHSNGTRAGSDCATLCQHPTPGPTRFYETNSQHRRPHQKTAQKPPQTVPFCAKSEQNTNTDTRFLPNELRPPNRPNSSTDQRLNETNPR